MHKLRALLNPIPLDILEILYLLYSDQLEVTQKALKDHYH